MQSIAMPNPITVHMYGAMKEKFGGPHKLHVTSPAAAFRLMEANFHQQFYRYLETGHFHVVYGSQLEGGRTLSADVPDDKVAKWLSMSAQGDIHIVPALTGASKKGTILVIAGTVLIAAALFASGGTLGAPLAGLSSATAIGGAGFFAGATLTVGTLASSTAALGLSLAIGGIFNLLTRAQATNQGDSGISGGLFGSPANTSNQGTPVPVIYGRAQRAGSVIISARVDTASVALS